MHSLYDFIVKPVDDHRYNNKKEIESNERERLQKTD